MMGSWTALETWFAEPRLLLLAGWFPLLAVLRLLALRRQQRRLMLLGPTAARHTRAGRSPWAERLGATCRSLGWSLVLVGLAGPHWGRDWDQPPAPGRDLVLVLDLSRSMLATDVLPSRAERAKAALVDLTYAVQQRGGHRLALVAFAGRAQLLCPLTQDYDHLRTVLADLDVRHPPASVRAVRAEAVSGTRIGAALRAAIAAHDGRLRGTQAILLISDGDDPAHDEEWREGIWAARSARIPVHTVGIGNPLAGSVIPLEGDVPLRFEQGTVQTRLEEEPLATIARMTGGVYTPARTEALPLGQLFHEQIEPGAAHEQVADLLPVYRERYPWFFGAALVFLGAEMGLACRRNRRPAGGSLRP